MSPTRNHPARHHRPSSPPTYIVRLHKHGLYKGAVGPFASELDATRWARDTVGETEWTFAVEPVIAPIVAPANPGRAPRRHLELVR